MSAEEFLEYIDQAKHYRDKGKARLNRARDHYAAYVRAYRAPTFEAFYLEASTDVRGRYAAVRQAARDRDSGKSMVQCPELLGGG